MPALLFVNKDGQSSSFGRSTDANEKISINAHVQRGRKHARKDQMPIMLDRSRRFDFQLKSTTWSAQGADGENEAQSPTDEDFREQVSDSKLHVQSTRAPHGYEYDSASRDYPSHQLDGDRKRSYLHLQRQRLIDQAICRKDSATDPFNTSCIKVDHEVHNLLQFYAIVFHPNTWHAEAHKQPQVRGKYTFAKGAKDIIRGCLQDEMNMYCILASMASRFQMFENLKMKRDMSFYMSRALAATRNRIELHRKSTGVAAVVDAKMVMNIFYLGVAEWLRLELDAALIHLEAVKKMADCVGGMNKLDGQLREMVGLGDTYLAAERLSKPVFDASDFDPGEDAFISAWLHSHGVSERGRSMELLAEKHEDVVSTDLQQIVKDLDNCITVLVLSQQQPDFPPGTPRWIYLRDLAIRNRLLALSVTKPRTEALRIALIMWELMVMTVSPRQRTIKLMAPKLRAILLSIRAKDWVGHELLRCWILSIGSMSSLAGSEVEKWFVDELLEVSADIWGDQHLLDEEALRDLSCRFFHLDSIQASIIRDLAKRIAEISITK